MTPLSAATMSNEGDSSSLFRRHAIGRQRRRDLGDRVAAIGAPLHLVVDVVSRTVVGASKGSLAFHGGRVSATVRRR